MAAPVPPDMSGMLPDMQQRSDHPSGTRSHELERQVSRRHSGARSHESERQTGRRRWRGGSPQPRIASQAWTAYQDLRQDVDAVAKAKAFEDAPQEKACRSLLRRLGPHARRGALLGPLLLLRAAAHRPLVARPAHGRPRRAEHPGHQARHHRLGHALAGGPSPCCNPM